MANREEQGQQLIRELAAYRERVKEVEKLLSHQTEALRGAQAMYESLFELAPDALIVVDRLGHITKVNAQAERLFGYGRGELVGKDHAALVPERFAEKHSAEMKDYMREPRIRVMGIGLDLWGRRKDGSEFPADIDLGPLDVGKDFLVLAVVRDVTQRKQIEVSLLESEKRYRDLVELSPDAVIVNSEGSIIFVNSAGVGLLGGESADQLAGKQLTAFVHPDDRQAVAERIGQVLEGKMAPLFELKIIRGDGSDLFAEAVSMPFNFRGRQAMLSIVRDITERKRADMARRETEERYRRTLDSMLEGGQIIGFDWRYLYLNDTAVMQARLPREELLGHTMMEKYPGIENTPVFGRLKACMEERRPARMENEFTFPDGTQGWFELSIQPAPEGVFVLSIDVTEHKRLEQELNRYRRRLEDVVAERTVELARTNAKLAQEIAEHEKAEAGLSLRATILDNAPMAIFLLNPRGDFVYTNEAASMTYGFSRNEFMNMNLRRLLPAQDAPLVDGRLKHILEKRHLELETVHVRKDGISIPVEVRHALIKTLHGEFIVSLIREIPARQTG